ncbi:hypothetical protein [Caulobacter endophyticus]|uniref:hypothetical protein n=1 Tax=Caulobacter endophyticus TaxID=2172652 RepID=UPI0011B226C0|nr:hypothetical protein [Caulobacter endophyticus]
MNGCGWGDRRAYLQFEAASQVLAWQYRHEIGQSLPPDAKVALAHVDLTEVFAEPADMVAKVADRAVRLNALAQPATHIIALRPDADYPPTIAFDWLQAPPRTANKYEVMEAASVDYTSDEGAAAMAAWCGRERSERPSFALKRKSAQPPGK